MKDIKITDNIKVSSQLDEYILKGLENGIEIKNNKVTKEANTKNRPYFKVAMLVATISAATIAGVYAIDKIIDYFKYNKESIYKYEEHKLEKYAKAIKKSKKHEGVEFILDTVAADDSYVVINYTVKSDKKIAEYGYGYDNPMGANPFVRLLKGEKEVFDGGAMENEATFVSEYELKGIMRYRVGRFNLEQGTKLTIDMWDVLGIEGDWKIDFKLNKVNATKDSKKYNINKSQTIAQKIDYKGELLEIKNKITVDNVVIAPLGNTITITEAVDTPDANYIPSIGDSFVLFDENNKHVRLVSNGGQSPDTPNKPLTSTYEFILNNKDIKSMTLVPITYSDKQSQLLESQTIEKLPIRFKVSEYGTVIVDDFEVKEEQIKYSLSADGFVSYLGDIALYDGNGEIIILENSFSEQSIDRDNDKVDIIIKLESDKDKELAKKIRAVSLYDENFLELNYDNQINIKLGINNH